MERIWEVLYHYTSLDSFVNIIKSRKFRLYDVTKSNDPLEGKYMLQSLEDAYYRLYKNDELKKDEWYLAHRAFLSFKEEEMAYGRMKDFYGVASFCVPTHELMMLRSYADNGRGVALGVPVTVLETLAENNPQLEFRKVEYLSKKEINQRADEFWRTNLKRFKKFNKETLALFIDEIKKFYYQSYFIKDATNEDEQEYRLLYHCEDLFKIRLFENAISSDIDFISSKGDLKAFYEILVGDRDKAPFYFNEIIIGPQSKVTDSELQTLLYRYGIYGCSIQTNSWVKMR